MKFKAVIFDMDGVISDTQKLHSKVESEILQRFNIPIQPEEIDRRFSGVRTKEFFDDLLKKQDKEYNLNELIKEKWEKITKLASISVDAIPGSINLIKDLHEKGYHLAVASASNLNYVKMVLKKLNVIDYFQALVSGDMVSKGKPEPESFLLAAKKINIKPEDCLVIEDGRSGMEAAKRANMKCIGLVKNKEDNYPTENKVTSLSEINQDYLNNLN